MGKNVRTDVDVLQGINRVQAVISIGLHEYKVNCSNDLSKIEVTARRGLVGFISDIFEMTKVLRTETFELLEINRDLMKNFQYKERHDYKSLEDTEIYAWAIQLSSMDNINATREIINKIQFKH